MKKYTLIVLVLLAATMAYGQNIETSGVTKMEEDEFTYKKINIVESSEGNTPLTNPNGTSASESRTPSNTSASAASGSSGIGETLGVLSVFLTGSAQYDVPIAVPVGVNGIAPEISLRYDSQSGNGIVGYGWNISGISSISRVPSTKYHDNQIRGINFDSNDRFALDGQRLILKSGTYGANGAQYETEAYSNLRITSHGTTNRGPEYFIVEYPDGSIAKYGGNSSAELNYSINYWENPQGVRVSYFYNFYNIIKSITYGGIKGIGDMNVIDFHYDSAPRDETSYYGNKKFDSDIILKNIKVKSNNVQYRRYNINNSNNTGLKYARVSSITEYSGDNSSQHSSISFSYDTTSSSVNHNKITTDLNLANIEQRNAIATSLDLTGNGKMDFIISPNTKDKFWIFTDIQNGSSLNDPYEVDTNGTFKTIFPTTWLNHDNNVMPGQGFTVVQNKLNNSVDFKVYSNGLSRPINLQYTKTWTAPIYNYDYTAFSSTKKRIPFEYVSGDFNGDGLTDVLAIGKPYTSRHCTAIPCDDGDIRRVDSQNEGSEANSPDTTNENEQAGHTNSSTEPQADVNSASFPFCSDCKSHNQNYAGVYYIDLKRNITTGFANQAGYLRQRVASNDKLKTGDFNGDGKTDILHVTNGKLFVYTLTDNNTLTLLWQTDDTAINLSFAPLLGDYNGDGKTDFLLPTAPNSYSFKWFISTGTAFKRKTRTQPFKYQQTNWNGNNGVLSGYNLIPLDINGDGKTDIVEYNTTTYNSGTNGTETIKIYNNLGTNSSHVYLTRFVHGGTASRTGNLKHYPIPIYLTSDQPNKNLDFASISDRWITSFSFTQDHREDVLIRSITNNGVTQTIDYGSLDASLYDMEYGQLYADQLYTETYPNVDLHLASTTKVVRKLKRISTGTTILKQAYAYQGAVYNAQGLGFLGFRGIAKSNWHTGYSDRIYSVTKFSPSLRGAPTDQYTMARNYTFTVPSSGYISKTTNQYTSALSGSKVFKLSLTSSLTQNALEGRNTNVSYIYDAHNNPTKITTAYLGTGTNVVDITYTNNTGTSYYIGRPSLQIETNTIKGETFKTAKQFRYSGNLLSLIATSGNGTPYGIEVFTYDAFGNIIKKKTWPYGETPREVEYEYDATGRFLVKTIDVENLETTFQYNVNTGTLSKETNPFGQQTSFTYDEWNRPIKVTDYLGNDLTTSYVESNYVYTVTNTGDDGSGTIAVYDPLKRMTASKHKNVLGQWVTTSYQYDKFDRPYKVSEPFTGNGASQWNQTEYDFYGRPIKLTEYTGRVTSIAYNGLTTTVNDGTKTVTTTRDAMGNVVSMTDPGGTINYSYFGNGSLKSADYNGVVVEIEQDEWGRKTKLTDPSAGVYTYTYNGFGQITKETTPKGATSYTYSTIGKLTQKQVTGDNTSMTMQYSYTNPNPLNTALSAITLTGPDGNNASYSYQYDSFERLKKIVETNAHAKFEKLYTYDGFGRVDTEEHRAKLLSNAKRSIKKTKNIYQNGGLKSIKDFSTNQVLWNLNGVNARGQVTESTMGNNLKRRFAYDAYGYLTESRSEKGGSSPVELMKLTTRFDRLTGRLKNRENAMFNWAETFTYDSMDRLVNFNDNDGNHNHTYDALGRITSNSSVGDYSYRGRSYQVDDIALNKQGDLYYQGQQLQQVSYNAFKKPFDIHEKGKERIGFQYNAFMGRAHMFYGDTHQDVLKRNNRKHYAFDGSMEISYDAAQDKTTFVTYIGGDGYSAPAIWRSEQGSAPAREAYYYLHRDYLGSIMMITDGNGTIKEKRHFDAWGNIVKLTDGNGKNLDKFVYLDRGYTGHEHLQGANLIHMNGRLYSPKLKRFLAPDNYIQDVGNTQNFNRYAYVMNNPLMYVDPNGEMYGNPERPGLSGGEQVGLGAAVASILGSVNWDGLRFNDVDDWATKHIFRPIQDIGDWIGGWFKKRSKHVDPVEYANYEGLTADPLAGTSTDTSPSHFGGGGTGGNLGIVGRYYGSLWNGFTNRLSQTGEGLSNLLSDPLGAIGGAARNHWATITSPARFLDAFNETYASFDPISQLSRNLATSFGSDDFFGTIGGLNGGQLADKSVEAVGLAAGGVGGRVFGATGRGSATIYRAVSKAELGDIAKFGLRNKAGAYETGKLFAPTAREAAQFGKNNFMFDGLPNTIIKVRVPNRVLNNSYRFGADGMNAISISSKHLYRLRATPLNYTPLR